MTIDAVPAINAIYLDINGLRLVGAFSNTTLTVSSGICRDSTDVFDMDLGNFLGVNPNVPADTSTIVSSAINGINGLDTGTIAVSTTYALYVIADPIKTNPSGLLLSLSATQPTMPFGYSLFRRIGWALTDSSGNFKQITQVGTGAVRTYEYATPFAILTGGVATTFTNVLLATAVPNILAPVFINATYTGVAANVAGIRMAGIQAGTLISECPIKIVAQVSAVPTTMSSVSILNRVSPSAIQYAVVSGDALTIEVSGWTDYL
jgi:hypothetical protein